MNARTLLTALLMSLMLAASAQNAGNTIIQDVSQWISKSDIQRLTEQFDSNLQMNILEKENFHSKAQAGILIKDFFKNHPVTSFVVQHKGGGESNLFMVAKLISGSEEFRVSIHFRKVNGADKVSFLSIEQIKK